MIRIQFWHGTPQGGKHDKAGQAILDWLHERAVVELTNRSWLYGADIGTFASAWGKHFIAYPSKLMTESEERVDWDVYITQYSSFGQR